MTYYDELGLAATASPDEIRRAYRALARRMHPDVHRGEAAQQAAEAQFKRLNAIVEVLTDPARRRCYDAAMRAAAVRSRPLLAPAPAGSAVLRFRGWWAWAAALGLAGSAILILLRTTPQAAHPYLPEPLGQSNAKPVAPVRERAAEAPPPARPPTAVRYPAAEAKPVDANVLQPRAVIPPRSAARQRSTALPRPPAFEQPPPALTESPVAASPAKEPVRGFGGVWLYAPGSGGAPAMYRPEYIELIVKQSGDRIKARYRARYRVADRPISPVVAFEFEGPAAGDHGVYGWSAAGGRGQVSLKRTGSNTVEVNWRVTEFGDAQDLASGSAVLVRVEE